MSLSYYRGMLIQDVRMQAFATHIAETVKPEHTVLEIGTGLGTYAFFACKAGARKVYAIDGNASLVVAKSIAQDNALRERLEFLRGWFPDVRPMEPADVIIFEDYSSRLIDRESWALLNRMHQPDVLKTDGILIPNRAKIYVAPVHSPDNWRIFAPLGGDRDYAYGIDWSASRSYVVNEPIQMPFAAPDVVAPPVELADVTLSANMSPEALGGNASWTMGSTCVVHGLLYWFELEVGPGVWLSNAPGKEPGAWGSTFLPFEHQCSLTNGDTLDVSVSRDTNPDGSPGWFRWSATARDFEYDGHEFKSFAAGMPDLVRATPDWKPNLSSEGIANREILRLANGERTVAEIGAELRNFFPNLTTAQIETLVNERLDGLAT